MSELVPSSIAHQEALSIIRELMEEEDARDLSEIVSTLNSMLVELEDSIVEPRLRYEPVVEGEPPSSKKANRTWKRLQDDINILKSQMDVARAGTLLFHNGIATEVEYGVKKNAQLENKLKTLQLYAVEDDDLTTTFSDTFQSTDGIDIDSIDRGRRPSLMFKGRLTLGLEEEATDLGVDSEIRVRDESNGFLGNNQTVKEDDDHPENEFGGSPLYTFKAETRDYRDLGHLVDGEPDTWIEYESYYIPEERRPEGAVLAYKQEDGDGTEEVDWADSPEGETLKLSLRFDFRDRRNLNHVLVRPKSFGDKTYPIQIRSITVSPDGTDWEKLTPADVWLSPEASLRSARTAEDVATGSASWSFEARSVRYVDIVIEQPNAMKQNVGYIYWVDEDDPEGVLTGDLPLPDIYEPERILERTQQRGHVQQRGMVEGKRWAIGLGEISLMSNAYKSESEMVTPPLNVDGVVDRVMLEDVTIDVPEEYPADEMWIRFFVSPDNGQNWHPIAPIQDDYYGIPHQIAYNDPLAEEFRETGVEYYEVDDTVNSLRFKAEMRRPEGYIGTTPALKDYTLKVLRRE